MGSGYSSIRFHLADWYSFSRYPYFHARFTDPPYWHTQQKIKQYEKLIKAQPWIKERLIILGPDLAAANFLCHRNCRVRFKGREDWTEVNSKTLQLPDYVPQGNLFHEILLILTSGVCPSFTLSFEFLNVFILTEYTTGWYIEEIDASNSTLIYEGLQNLRNLLYIKKLDISYSKMIDAWCLDRITGEFQDSLEYLDISGCTSLNWNGLECIWRLRKLKVLVLQDMDHIKDLDLLCLMLLEILPELQIRGVDYMANAKNLLAGSEAEHLLEELDKSLLLLSDGVITKQDIVKSESVDTQTNKETTDLNHTIINMQ